MAVSPSANYTTNVVDVPLLGSLVGTEWITQSVLLTSGAMYHDSRPLDYGTNTVNIRREIFERTSGQAPASDGTISFRDIKDTEYRSPIFVRADGANILTLQGVISAGGVIDYNQLSANVSAKAAYMLDESAVKVVEGVGGIATASGSDATATLALLNTARWSRGDKGNQFMNGHFFCRSELMATLFGLGVVAPTSNTWGLSEGGKFSMLGQIPMIQGMTAHVSNKISLVGGVNHYAYMIEPGAIIHRGGETPTIEVAKIPDGFGTRIMFYIRAALGFQGAGWTGESDVITDTDLSTAANWALKAAVTADIKMVRWETDDD